ncbi:MAG: L,D-transpeptidase [Clostridia bacterium]|nr:L,D-transpeptidase [Clostridia bacterium]
MVSRVGSIVSDHLIGAKAIRFNSGDLLHEVPYVKNGDGSKNYKTTEAKLGIRASHGCIRVQRLRNQDGINQAWLWDNLPIGESGGTKLVIWEDFAGRQISIPEDSTPIYYNPKGGTMYHAVANCPGVKKTYLPLTGTTYSELEEGSFASLPAAPTVFRR